MLSPAVPQAGIENYELGDMKSVMKGISVFSFREGIKQLTESLLRDLEAMPNVKLHRGTGIHSIGYDNSSSTFRVSTTTI
jgi:oxygen-dependent protoporphyrinogen oxidase